MSLALTGKLCSYRWSFQCSRYLRRWKSDRRNRGSSPKRPPRLSEDGVVLAVATVDFESQMIISGPDILSRGFVYMRESGDLIRQSQRILFNAIRIALKNKDASVQSVNGAIVNAIRPFLYENTEREPIIIPMILTPDEE